MAQIEAREAIKSPGRFERIGSMIGAFLDRLLSPSVVAVGFVILAFFIIRTGFEMHRYYQSLDVQTIENENDDLWQQIYSNLGIEVLSIAVTVIVIERLNQREAERERKEELILQMGSPDNGFAVEAVRRLRAKGCGIGLDKSLIGVDLFNANLQEAFMRNMNLQKVELDSANLQEADLEEANLKEAFLEFANLREATVTFANLQSARLKYAFLEGCFFNSSDLRGADLEEADLQQARLMDADLQGANLLGANLQWAVLGDYRGDAKFDETTILPDGTKWTPGRKMEQFTDPEGWAAGKYKTDTNDAS